MSGTGRTVNAEALRELGFAEDLIQEALTLQKRGVLAVEPPADLVQRTLEKCAHLFPEEASRARPDKDPAWEIFHEALGFKRMTTDPMHFAAVAGKLSNQYFASLAYAFTSRQRPLVMLDNHNLVQPGWWEQDPLFRCMSDATGAVNRTVREHGLAPSALFVMLRPQVRDYGKTELRTIARQIEGSSSDIWWIPYDASDPYSSQDVAALGEESVLKIDVQTETPLKAIAAMKTTTDPTLVRQVRSDLLAYIHRATPVKVNGLLHGALVRADVNPDNVRSALDMVISGAVAAKAPAAPSTRVGAA